VTETGPLAGWTHLDASGQARMVDVAGKPVTHRRAVATCTVRMAADTLQAITSGQAGKGDVLATARIAGIMAAKRTSEWIPLCHPLALTHVRVDLQPCREPGPGLKITATAETEARTGVEMEALTAASAAALTVYDMCKALDRGMVIDNLRLLRKEGGRSGAWKREEDPS